VTDLSALQQSIDILRWGTAQIAELKATVKAIDEVLDPHRDTIKELLGDEEEGSIQGRPVVKWSKTVRKSLSVAKVRELHPEVAAECLVEQVIRKFEVISE
jgi:hypothetical protein